MCSVVLYILREIAPHDLSGTKWDMMLVSLHHNLGTQRCGVRGIPLWRNSKPVWLLCRNCLQGETLAVSLVKYMEQTAASQLDGCLIPSAFRRPHHIVRGCITISGDARLPTVHAVQSGCDSLQLVRREKLE